jgi:hypothetical protein
MAAVAFWRAGLVVQALAQKLLPARAAARL